MVPCPPSTLTSAGAISDPATMPPSEAGTARPYALDAMADEHGEPGVGGFRRELADQPGLADAGLTADERERRVAATGQPHWGRQRGHLVATAHEDRAHYAGAHDPDVATPGRPLAINCGRHLREARCHRTASCSGRLRCRGVPSADSADDKAL
jgi:hypothetical protein